MNDVLPEDTPASQRLERIARETLCEYGYRELHRVPRPAPSGGLARSLYALR